MYELLCIFAGICFFVSIFATFESFTSRATASTVYTALACIVMFLLLYFLIKDHLNSENYTMEKDSIITDTLDLDGSTYKLILPNNMKVFRDKYTLSLSDSWDYIVYKLYIDSTRYIEIRNSKYDTLDVKYGKLKVDKNE